LKNLLAFDKTISCSVTTLPVGNLSKIGSLEQFDVFPIVKIFSADDLDRPESFLQPQVEGFLSSVQLNKSFVQPALDPQNALKSF
jgi:hypothetical protein